MGPGPPAPPLTTVALSSVAETSQPPRVGVVVLNYGRGDLTLRCLRTVLSSDWPPESLEVVLVDNASDDGVAERARDELRRVRVVDAGTNLGFAGGCNLGIRVLGPVDHVALLNNDATVEPGWLEPLVSALEADPGIGAACPKILFDDAFVDVALTSDATNRGVGDRRPLGVQISGARLDGRESLGRLQFVEGFWGVEHGPDGSPAQWTDGRSHLRVPARSDRSLPAVALRLAAGEPRTVSITSGPQRVEHRVGPDPAWYEVSLGGDPFDVVNNVGSVLLDDGFGADRGFLERDEGQYEQVEEVFAWCGAAVLLSRRYLNTVGVFDDRYFLYYEDFDVSWRGRAQGWRYLYVPGSPVRHVHSASTVAGSRLHQHYSERNRLLTLTRNAPAALVVRAAVRHVLVTASYTRRDVFHPLAHGRPPSWETIRRRTRALASFGGQLAPALVARRKLRRRQRVDDADIMRWSV